MQSYIAILLATGVGVGFASGLLGVGGAFIMVPVMWWIIEAMGIPSCIAIKVAFGTSLSVILPTTLSGAWRHSREKVVRWKAALIMGLCGAGGAVVGATIAAHLPGHILKIGFGGLLLAVALWMGLGESRVLKVGSQRKQPSSSSIALVACGFPVGLIGGLAGIGGGMVMVPAMVLALGFPMHVAVGTSTAAIIFTSLGGVTGYIINGIGVSGLPLYSIGYVNLPICLCLIATSVPMAQLGARTAHTVPAKQLRYIFVALTIYLGLRMVGVLS